MRALRSCLCAVLAGAMLGNLTAAPAADRAGAADARRVDFSYQIRPLLSDRCFRCHGPDAGKRKAKLRLDTREGTLKKLEDVGKGWAVVKPGDPDKSELIRRIFAADDDDRMPPVDSHLTLSAADKALLKRWVAEGADYRPHWSLVPVHAVGVPALRDGTAPTSPIDAFVRTRLEEAGLTPVPQATPEIIIRRLSFNLTGLPPTPANIDAFVADRSPGAYDRAIDHYLASPAYGERMAMDWLDLARYADTYGYQADVDHDMSARTFRPLLERDHGILFADEALADRFSFEVAYPIGKPFGFHGLFNFCRTVPPAEIAAMAATFSTAIALSPQLLQLLRNCIAMSQWDAARAIARRILAAAPDRADVQAMLVRIEQGATQPTTGRNDPCPCGSGMRFKQCHGALGSGGVAAAPARFDADALVRTALSAHQRGDLDLAERVYRDVLAQAPTHPLATHFLGVVLYQRNRIEEALPLLQAAVEAVPQEAEFHNNLGLALAAADRHEEAIGAYRCALRLRPEHAVAWSNLGLALHVENRLSEAIDAFRCAIALVPDFAQAHWNLGLALLAHQDFAEGWHEYEWRHRTPEFARVERVWPGPRWDGSAAAGRTLLVTTEQGLGDTLHFIRFAQPLAASGARVLVSAQAPLVRLLATAPGVTAVYATDETPPAYDAHIPLIALAGVLGVTPTSIPAKVPYLTADPMRRAEIARMLSSHADVRKVGIAWSGSRLNTLDRRRSIPLHTLAPLFDLPGIAWFSLQRSIDEAGIEHVPAAQALHRLPAREDFDGMAALVAELDLVISVDTSIAHLGGALARPTWMMLAAATDWRWHTCVQDTPWYPTVRLFRQPSLGDWAAVVRDVAAALAGLSQRRELAAP